MASIATRKVSSPVRKRWTDTRGAYRRGPCPPGRRAGTGPVRPGPGSVLGGCGGVVAVDEADGVDAVALVGGGGEALALDAVAGVLAAGGAAHRDAPHAQRGVLEQLDRLGVRRRPEGGPSAVRVELGGGGEQLRTAGAAGIGAGRPHLLVLPGAGALGASLAQHLVLGGGQSLAPLLLADRDGVGTGADGFGGHEDPPICAGGPRLRSGADRVRRVQRALPRDECSGRSYRRV